jgi:hypothetical protein
MKFHHHIYKKRNGKEKAQRSSITLFLVSNSNNSIVHQVANYSFLIRSQKEDLFISNLLNINIRGGNQMLHRNAFCFQHTALVGSEKATSYTEPGRRGTGIRITKHWGESGMECSPQVPPYEPSKYQREIKAVKGHKIGDQSWKASRNKGLLDQRDR